MYSASFKINLGSSSIASSKDFGLKKGKLTGADDFYYFKGSCALLKIVAAPYLCRFKSCMDAICRIRQPDAL